VEDFSLVPVGLALSGVTKRYTTRGPWVLIDTDLTLAPATRTDVVGSNGSGKSTLMRIAAGVTSPTGGTTSIPRRIGYVPERQAGTGKFTAQDYLSHMGRIRGLSAETVRQRARELLDQLNLQPGPQVAWERLSKGNRQKVIVAQAFLGDCDAIVLDEPFSGLDAEATATLEGLISDALANGAAVLTSGPEAHRAERSDYTYRLMGGGLLEVHSGRQLSGATDRVMTIELSHANGPGAAEVCRLPGVLTWQADRMKRLVLEVERGALRSVLRTALDQGWFVESVGSRREGSGR
jgi:ABC-type multidrug transport system ATPase subunit